MQDLPKEQPAEKSAGLVTLFELKEDTRQEWNAEELSAILRHQLRAPLRLALGQLSAEVEHQLQKNGGQRKDLATLGDLFRHPQPPGELLSLTKRFAKRCIGDPGPLPREIAIFLYYVSIAVAQMRCKRQVSDLPPNALQSGLQWCDAQKWVDEPMRLLVKEALRTTAGDATGPNAAMPIEFE